MPTSFTLYTDGSCLGNPGPGGWGVVLKSCDVVSEWSGFCADTTNNRMEMQAVIEGLRHVPEGSHATIYTDSQYVQKGVEEWLQGWKKRNWKTSSGSAVKNQDLWQTLDTLLQGRTLVWRWVRGHAGDAGNERAHHLAYSAASKKGTP